MTEERADRGGGMLTRGGENMSTINGTGAAGGCGSMRAVSCNFRTVKDTAGKPDQ